MPKSILTKKILYWYDNNKRELPWRKKISQIKREYYTLVSEFMLQQTQVTTVIPYFNNFIKNIPNVTALSKINESKLLKYWEGLGYYSRVKNLKRTANIIEKNFNDFSISVTDNSLVHKGHNNFNGKEETHIIIELKKKFNLDIKRLEIHKKINTLLSDEFKLGLHALQIKIT